MESMCKWCSQTKPMIDFVKGQANYSQCKSCVALKQRQKIACNTCQKSISYGNMSKHMFTHNNNNPLKEKISCVCGTVVSKYALPKHVSSKKHTKLV